MIMKSTSKPLWALVSSNILPIHYHAEDSHNIQE